MKIKWNKTILTGAILLSMASVIGAITYSKSVRQEQKPTTFYQANAVTEAPPVISKVKGLEITSTRLVNQGTPQASVEIDVTNNRDSDVMSIDLMSGKDDYSALRIDGLLEESAPEIVIPRHSLKTFSWGLSMIMSGETVFLAAAVFSDGKEEGDKRSLNGIKIHRRNYQQKQREAKAKNGGQQ